MSNEIRDFRQKYLLILKAPVISIQEFQII